VVVLAVGLLRRSSPPPAEAGPVPVGREIAAPETAVAAPLVATPDPCAATRPLLRLIAEQEQQGKYLLAASNAETGLTQPDVCPPDRDQLAQKAVAGRLQALWAESIRPDDRDAQEHAVDVYREAVALADRYAVPAAGRPGLQVVADRAYQGGQFLLAKHAVDQLLETNPASADRPLLRRYYASLRNLGLALSGAASATAKDEGLALLVAADMIDQKYRLEQGEATRDLVTALGPDRAHWPAPAPSPLLAPSDRPGRGRVAGG